MCETRESRCSMEVLIRMSSGKCNEIKLLFTAYDVVTNIDFGFVGAAWPSRIIEVHARGKPRN